MKRGNLQRLAERGVQMKVVPDDTLTKEELKIHTEDSTVTYSVISDLHYSIHEV